VIVNTYVGLVWRLLVGAVFDAVVAGRLDEHDPRIQGMFDYLSSPGDETR
jgi:hypothetical protein